MLNHITVIATQWQHLLRLDDWDVLVKLHRANEDPFNYGTIEADPMSKTAVMSILDPQDWKPSELTVEAVEDTVIHELIHLHFRQAGFPYEESLEEKAVHSLAKAFGALT